MQDEPVETLTPEPYEEVRRERPVGTSVTVTIGAGFWRNFFKWASGIALVFVLGTLLLSLNLMQLTSPKPAHESLRRAIAGLTEIDSLIVDGHAALKEEAATSPDGDLRLDDYPIDVPLSPGEVQELSTPELRDVLLSRSADRLYRDGIDAFREADKESAGDIALFSAPGAVRYTVGLLTEDTHDVMSTLTLALVVAALVLVAVLLVLSRGYGRLTSLGSAVCIATLPFLLVAVALRFVLRIALEGEGDYLTAQLFDLGKDLAWLPVRTGIAFAGLGIILLVVGVAFSSVDSRMRARA